MRTAFTWAVAYTLQPLFWVLSTAGAIWLVRKLCPSWEEFLTRERKGQWVPFAVFVVGFALMAIIVEYFY